MSVAVHTHRPKRRVALIVLNLLVTWSLVLAAVSPALPEWLPAPVAEAAEAVPPVADTAKVTSDSARVTAPQNQAPTTLEGAPELVERRDAHTRHYRVSEGKSVAVVTEAPQNYLAPDGRWYPIDARFEGRTNGYIIAANSLASSVGRYSSKASLSHGDTHLVWEPTALVALDANETPVGELARPQPSTTAGALAPDRLTLTFRNHWSDKSLRETFVSGPGSLEQSLILAERPHLAGSVPPQWLALEATLTLMPGTTLWVDGVRQSATFAQAERVEIRTDSGQNSMVMAPVVAYEEATPTTEVAGHYTGELVEEGVWRLRVVTPWAWWADSARRYPAVLDPQFSVVVLKPVRVYDQLEVTPPDGIHLCGPAANDRLGVGWENTYNEDGHTGDRRWRSVMFFDKLPSLPPGASLTGARLNMQGSLVGKSAWLRVSAVDQPWDPENDITCPTTGVEVDLDRVQVPDDAVVSCKLTSGQDTGPQCEQVEGVDFTKVFHLSDTVLPFIESWYSGGPNHGLLIQPATDQGCSSKVAAAGGWGHISSCYVKDAKVGLQLLYDEPSLFNNDYHLEIGVPSYDQGVYFGDADHHLYQASHYYSNWGGIAVAAPSFLPNNPHVEAPLNMLRDLGSNQTEAVVGNVVGTNNADGVNYILIDDKNGAGPNELLYAQVRADPNNDFTQNDGGLYSIQAVQGEPLLPDPSATWTTYTPAVAQGELLTILTFNLDVDESLLVSMTLPTTHDFDVRLFSPQPGQGTTNEPWAATPGDGFADVAPDVVGANYRYLIEAEAAGAKMAGTWALVLANNEADICPGLTGKSSTCVPPNPVIQLLACPKGTDATALYGCQALIFPHTTVAHNQGGTSLPPTPFRDLGGVRLFSEGGFVENPEAAYSYCTTDEDLGMPLLGLPTDALTTPPTEQLIAVKNGRVCVTSGPTPKIVLPSHTVAGTVTGPAIRDTAASPVPLHSGAYNLYAGEMYNVFGTQGPNDGKMQQRTGAPLVLERMLATTTLLVEPWAALWDEVVATTDAYIQIDERAAKGSDSGTLILATDVAPTNLPIAATWSLIAKRTAPRYDFVANTETMPGTLEVASLLLKPKSAATLAYSEGGNGPRIEEVRLPNAIVQQSAQMGGAYKPVRAVLRPPTQNVHGDLSGGYPDKDGKDTNGPCGVGLPNSSKISCVDMRHATDFGRLDWEMPDVALSEEAGMVAMRKAGELSLFSADHPNGMAADPAEMNFDFETFAAKVSVEVGVCPSPDSELLKGGNRASGQTIAHSPQEDEQVLIIRGEANFALPALNKKGDENDATDTNAGNEGDGGGPGLIAGFILCQTKLRQISLTFDAHPPGITLGSSGLMLKSIGATLWVDPAYVYLEVTITGATVDGVLVTDLEATLAFDTRGLFRLGGGATLVGYFDISGFIQVAWRPLDVLQEANITFKDWFTGYMRMHLWKGQGWQNKYSWLPDDNATHFTGLIGATFTIKKERLQQWLALPIPRKDIVFKIEIAFGEFCTNDGCTKYEWGIQGKLQVNKFSVGAYLGKSGADFFLGDKGHTLIDQHSGSYKGLAGAIPSGPISDLASGKVIDVGPIQGPCPQVDSTATCTLSVPPGAGQVMIVVGWSQGTMPTVQLMAPGNVPITKENIEDYGVLMDGDMVDGEIPTSIIYTIENPLIGDWALTLSDLTGNENYSLLFAANSETPTLALTTPPAGGAEVTSTLGISWSVTPPDLNATLHLSYLTEQEYVSNTISGTVSAGLPITGALPVTMGGYLWTVPGLPSGEYRIAARLDHPIHGQTWAVSPGTFAYSDTIPPAVPQGLTLHMVPMDHDGMLATWTRNSDPDLYGYEVLYNYPDPENPQGQNRVEAVLPSSPEFSHPTRERTRLTGLLDGISTSVCVRAIDLSGNRSTCSPLVEGVPGPGPTLALQAPAIQSLTAAASSLTTTWSGGNGDGYLLGWGRNCGSTYAGPLADEGGSNLDVGNTTSFTLNGLPPGTYRVALKSYVLDQGIVHYTSDWSAERMAIVTSGVDGDTDGLPDDLAEYYGVSGATNDADQDGLSNGAEMTHGTDPTRADSDGDGFSDNAEVLDAGGGGAPCDPGNKPAADTHNNLVLRLLTDEESLRYEATPILNSLKTDAAGAPMLDFFALPSPHAIRFEAEGIMNEDLFNNNAAGALSWTATATAPWLHLSKTAGVGNANSPATDIDVSLIETALPLEPGYYTAEVVITAVHTQGGTVSNSPLRVPVRLWMLRPGIQRDTRLRFVTFRDENGNGVQEPSEVTPVLDANLRVFNKTGVTVAGGNPDTANNFGVDHLPPGYYGVEATAPRLVQTTPNDLSLLVSEGVTTTVAVGLAEVGTCALNPDVTGDREINVLDISAVATLWNRPRVYQATRDLNCDTTIDIIDILRVSAAMIPTPQ